MAEVRLFRGMDCWRTWFFDECEQAGIFGINKKHLGLVARKSPSVVPYHVGTNVYLEDAPVFEASGKSFHRVCGPYEVISAEPVPRDAEITHRDGAIPILFLEARPEMGPWLNGTKRRYNVCGLDLKHRQTAEAYNFYPYRFRIRRSSRWCEEVIQHTSICDLCR
jgi:hypothetical protein